MSRERESGRDGVDVWRKLGDTGKGGLGDVGEGQGKGRGEVVDGVGRGGLNKGFWRGKER